MMGRRYRCCIVIILTVFVIGNEGAISGHCDDEMDTSSFKETIRKGDLSTARSIARELYQSEHCTETELSLIYQREADAFLEKDGALALIWDQVAQYQAPTIHHSDHDACWNFDSGGFIPETWDQCCSRVGLKHNMQDTGFTTLASSSSDNRACYRNGIRLCCAFFFGSTSYLRLPALRELELELSFPIEGATPIRLEQDGFLRRFDVAGILWPTGYLLSLCLSVPVQCGIYSDLYHAVKSAQFYPVAVELGAGIGAPAIALAQTLNRMGHIVAPRVIATDKAPSALALAIANSYAASHHHSVDVALLDHFDIAKLKHFKRQYAPDGGFSIVLGSSLQALFDGTEKEDHALWKILDNLLTESNRHAIAILAHTTETLKECPQSEFERLRVISGNMFGMNTRYGDTSDFEISVFRRRQELFDDMNDEL